jgi:hypothetical protein
LSPLLIHTLRKEAAMTTADVQTPAAEVEHNISAVVKQLMAYRNETNADLAALLHYDVQTIGRKRRNERTWQAWEVQALADHYDVEVSDFYAGVDALFRLSRKADLPRTSHRKVGVSRPESAAA